MGYLDGRAIFSDDPQLARIYENERFAPLLGLRDTTWDSGYSQVEKAPGSPKSSH